MNACVFSLVLALVAAHPVPCQTQSGPAIANSKTASGNGNVAVEESLQNTEANATEKRQSSGNQLAIYDTEFAAKRVTVPAPGAPPVLTGSGRIYGGGSWISGHTYQVAYALTGFPKTPNGPLTRGTLSPAVSFTADGTGSYAFSFPGLSASERYTGIILCYNDTTAATGWLRTASIANPAGLYDGPPVQPADANVTFGGVLMSPTRNASRDCAGTGAVDSDGVTPLAAPGIAPAYVHLGTVPPGTYYAAYTFKAQDGSETSLSPISDGVTVSDSAGNWLHSLHRAIPPSGAVFICDYMGNRMSVPEMHKQGCFPLHSATTDLYNYNPTGETNSPGAAQSTISPLQLAIDAAASFGAAQVFHVASAGPNLHYTPLILRSNSSKVGLKVSCLGTGDINGTNSNCASNYSGTLTGVDNMIAPAINTIWDGIDVGDPNGRAAYALTWPNYVTSITFWNFWKNSTFSALAAGSIGCLVDVSQRNEYNHTASEQTFDNVGCTADAWAWELHGQQTADWWGHLVRSNVVNSTHAANSGQIRLVQAPFTLDVYTGSGAGRYVFHMSADTEHPDHGGMPNLNVNEDYEENYSRDNVVYFSASALNSNGVWATIRNSRNVNAGAGHDLIAVLQEAPGSLRFESPKLHTGDVLVAGGYTSGTGVAYQSAFSVLGDPSLVGAGGHWFESPSPGGGGVVNYGAGPVFASMAPIQICNGGLCPQFQTNSNSNMILNSPGEQTDPHSVVALDANGKLPPVDGSRLTNLPLTGRSYFTCSGATDAGDASKSALASDLDQARWYNECILPANAHLIRIVSYALTPPSNCATYPVIGVTDGTTVTDSPAWTSSSHDNDSGTLSVAYAVGKKMRIGVTAAESGCSRKAQRVVFNATFSIP
ncbi:MAG TPA: hypothetical protein VKB38_10650 [Terracidiphilus sp.]|nr:hypothetical protein [Terracidiphilus sp.]